MISATSQPRNLYIRVPRLDRPEFSPVCCCCCCYSCDETVTMKRLVSCLPFLLLLTTRGDCAGIQFHVIREWRYFNYTWPNDDTYNRAISSQVYIPENNVISGIKYFDGFYYLALPRMKNGVPATVARISATNNLDTAPLLEPYPSWEANEIDNCNSFQNVQNIEIDLKGQLWIIDGGHVSTLQQPPIERCPPKLVIYDIRTNRTVITYNFPENIANKQDSYLYDLVVDDTDGDYAYITDNSGKDPGIIVYSLRLNRAWKIRHPSMKADPAATVFRVNDVTVSAPLNIAGIALGPRLRNPSAQLVVGEDREVYFCPISSRHLYSVNASVLRDENNANSEQFQHGGRVRDLGLKNGQTAGMTMDSRGLLYYGLLGDTSIARWDSSQPFTTSQKLISKDPEYLQWPSSFAFDDMGNLLLITNKLQRFIYDKIRLDQNNFRILSAKVDSKSYFYDESPYNYDNRHDVPPQNPSGTWQSSSTQNIPQQPYNPSTERPISHNDPSHNQIYYNTAQRTSSIGIYGVFAATLLFYALFV